MKIRRGVPVAQYANPPGLPKPKRHPVRPSSGKRANTPNHDQLKLFYTTNPKGLAQWADKPHPWTSLFKIIRQHIPDLEFAKRVASRWFLDVFHETPTQHGAHLKGRAEWDEHLHPRDPHGEFAHVPGHKLLNEVEQAAHGGGGHPVDPGRDKLKLAGKIHLDPGEHLVGSSKVSDSYGSVRLAATENHGVRSLRIGVGNSAFGTREGGGPWTGGPDRHAEVAAAAAAYEREHEELESQLHDLPPGPQRDAVQKRLDELEESDAGGEVVPGGHTAKLDEAAASRLRAVLADVRQRGPEAKERVDAAWDQIPEGPVDYAKLRELEPGIDQYGEYMISEGEIPGEWGDLHYRASIPDPGADVGMRIAVVPHGSTLDEVNDEESNYVLTLADMAKLDRQIEALTTT